jgi:hypothetical protein
MLPEAFMGAPSAVPNTALSSSTRAQVFQRGTRNFQRIEPQCKAEKRICSQIRESLSHGSRLLSPRKGQVAIQDVSPFVPELVAAAAEVEEE